MIKGAETRGVTMQLSKRKTTAQQVTVEAGVVTGSFRAKDGSFETGTKMASWRSGSRDEADLYFRVNGSTSKLSTHVQEGRMASEYNFVPKK
jgi:hypothetical protein